MIENSQVTKKLDTSFSCSVFTNSRVQYLQISLDLGTINANSWGPVYFNLKKRYV